MAEPIRGERLPENTHVRRLFGRVDVAEQKLSTLHEFVKHVVTHKALIGYAALFVAATAGAVWALMLNHETHHASEVVQIRAEVQEVKVDQNRQEVKVDGLKDLIMTGRLRTAWPETPPAPAAISTEALTQ
jgi:deferrochelatase/peroxidase EfeB